MDDLCYFKIKIESQTSEYDCTKDQWPYPNQDQDPNPSQESPASCKAPNQDFQDIENLCNFKIKTESQNLEHWCTKDQWPYLNQGQDAKPQAWTSKAPNHDLKDMEVLCTLKITIRFGTWVNQWPLTISKSRSRCQTLVRNIQYPPKPKIRN